MEEKNNDSDKKVEMKKLLYSSDKEEHIIVIGNQAASLAAIQSIRKRNKKCLITVVSKDTEIGYFRPLVSKSLSREVSQKEFQIKPIQWYEDNNIILKLGEEVIALWTKEKKVETKKGVYIYDKLIVATGAYSYIPPFPGHDLKNVMTLRTIEDTRDILRLGEKSKKVVVVGGGVLGLEAAWHLKLSGLEVSVIEFFDRILPRQLDEHGSKYLQTNIEKNHISLVLSDSVDEIIETENNLIVKTKKGKEIATDFVIVSAGVRPNISIFNNTDVKIDKGAVVDQFMMTSEKNIYAAGDVAEYNGINYSIWPETLAQGDVAGANAVGDNISYEQVIPAVTFQGMDTKVFSVGKFGDQYNNVEFKKNDEYKKLFFENNRLVGAILLGDIAKAPIVVKGIRENATSETIIKKII
ncbi:MAG: NAD(P)/FAD-dependent oxidoreductase [Clostridiales bacterium]|nr:NAD(P)/FAD-dependent oxidoreductase [Clostridiales bacterium]